MKKFINFLLGLVMFNAIIALGAIISVKAVLSPNNISKMIYTLLETNKGSLDTIVMETDVEFSKYIDNKKLSEAMGKYINQTMLYNTEVSKTAPDRKPVTEEIRNAIKKYNKENKDQIAEDVADTYTEELKEFEEETFKEKAAKVAFNIIYSKKIFGIIIAIILVCLALILLNSDLNKLFFHLGLTTIISSIMIFCLLLLIYSLLKTSNDFKEIKPYIDISISKIRNIGIYRMLIGIVSMTLSRIIPKRELEEKKELS